MSSSVPYEKTQPRPRVMKKPKGKAPDQVIKIWFEGLHESGKTAIFKQLCHASGFRFAKEEKRMIRFGLMKSIFWSMTDIFKRMEKSNSPVLKDFHDIVGKIKRYSKQNFPKGFSQDYRKAEYMTIPNDIKQGILTLWKQDDTKLAFEQCKREGGYLVIDSFRLLVEKLIENKELRDDFGTKKFIPDDNILVFLSNAPRYPMNQYLNFRCGVNPSLVTRPVHENQHYSRPDLRQQTLQLPLSNPPLKKNKDPFWRFELEDPKFGTSPSRLAAKDCMVFTVDISAYDTLVGPSIGIKQDHPAAGRDSILKYSIEVFKQSVKKGHLIACIFTHVDLFWEKYQKMKIPINILDEFPDAPVWDDEQDDAIKMALAYFQDTFLRERHAVYNNLDASQSEIKNDLFKVFCINATDVTNVQGTLRALLEQFVGLNIPINANKITS